MAAIQTEEQVAQLDTNTRRAVFALVAQGEENVRLPAVSTPTQQHSVILCTTLLLIFFLDILYWTLFIFTHLFRLHGTE